MFLCKGVRRENARGNEGSQEFTAGGVVGRVSMLMNRIGMRVFVGHDSLRKCKCGEGITHRKNDASAV